MTSSRMQEFLSGLKSRDEDTRVRTAYSLQRYVFTELREVSAEEFVSFVSEFNSHIYRMAVSKDNDEKKGAIYAIICLNDLEEGQKTNSLSRSYNMLVNFISSCVGGVSELAVKALGRILFVSGPPTVSSIELLLNDYLKYIQGNDEKKKLSIMLCKELCYSVPSQFYQQIMQFFDKILTYGIWDSDASIREDSVAAISAALSVGTSREFRDTATDPPWYKQCLREILRGLEDPSVPRSGGAGDSTLARNLSREERLHVAFLLLNELLRHSNAVWESKASSLRHMSHYHSAPPKKEGVNAMIKRLRGNSTASMGLPTSQSLDQLVLSAQDKMTNDFQRPVESSMLRALLERNYNNLCSLITPLRLSRNFLVQNSLFKMLPRLAVFRPADFTTNGYLDIFIVRVL